MRTICIHADEDFYRQLSILAFLNNQKVGMFTSKLLRREIELNKEKIEKILKSTRGIQTL